MVSQSRTIELISKINPTVFQIINKDVFGTINQPLGAVQGAVRNILMNHELMLKTLMPAILTTSPNDMDWHKKVKNYWDSFGLKVPIGGIKLEVGLNFDIKDPKRPDITNLVAEAAKKGEKLESDKDLMNYVLTKVHRFEQYRYTTPINVQDYLTWIFLLGHRRVANDTSVIDKSTKIEFVLVDPKQVEDTRRAQHTISIEATKKYLEIITDRKKVRDILFIRGENASTLEDIDADAKLKTFADNNPREFLVIVNSPTMTVQARIERYCVSGILRRLPNSSIIVDAQDNGIVVGNTMEEAVAYFGSEALDRVAKVKEFATRYNQQIKVKN